MDSRMNLNDIKSLVCVGEPGQVKARYGDAIFPEDIAIVFSINLGFNVNTGKSNDPAGFFAGTLDGMVNLVRKEEEPLRDLDDAELAIVRRSVIFVLDRSMNFQIDKEAVNTEREARMARRQHNREHYRKSRV